MKEPDSAHSALMHEIRNHLAIARANIEACIDGKFAPTPERLHAVNQTLSELETLLESLQVVRPHVQSAAKPRRINVCVLLAGEFKAMEAVASEKNLALSITRCAQRAKECEHFVGDPARIGQIIKNVVLNAVRYTPKGGHIAIDCSRVSDEVQVTISDTGPGIADAEKSRVFESGFRGVSAKGSRGEGHGLAIVKRLVEEQGGSLMLASELGHGATFTVKLPGMVGVVS